MGDSYTIGQGLTEPERWPVQLVKRLREEGVQIRELQIIAKTGWTTKDLAAGIKAVNPAGPFDIVTLLIGVNNQFQGLDIQEFKTEFVALLQQSIQFAGGDPTRVIVISIPDWGVTPVGIGFGPDRIAREIDLFNSIGMEEAIQAGATYIDVTGVSRMAKTEPNLLADDGLHPSMLMYRRWVDLILPTALAISKTEPLPAEYQPK